MVSLSKQLRAMIWPVEWYLFLLNSTSSSPQCAGHRAHEDVIELIGVPLGAGSVAIDVIPAEDCVDADGAPLTTDQRGEPRPETGGTMCDVGAF